MKTSIIQLLVILIYIAGCSSDLNKSINLIDQKKYIEAKSILEALLAKDSLNQKALALRGYCYAELGNYDSAIRDLNCAVKLNPKDIKSLMNLGDAYYKTREFTLAKEVFNWAYVIDNKNGTINYNLGVVYFEEEKYDSALLYFDKQLELNPHDADAYFNKGHLLFLKDKDDQAIIEIRKGLEFRKSATGYFFLGLISFKKGNYFEATQFHSKAILLDPNDKEFYVKRSAAFGMLGEFDKTISDCNMALKIDSLYYDAYESRMLAYKHVGKQKEYEADSLKLVELNKQD